MTFLDLLDSPKCDFTQNRCGENMIKFQQSQALTSHFESFCSLVNWYATVWKFQEFTTIIYKEKFRETNIFSSTKLHCKR